LRDTLDGFGRWGLMGWMAGGGKCGRHGMWTDVDLLELGYILLAECGD